MSARRSDQSLFLGGIYQLIHPCLAVYLRFNIRCGLNRKIAEYHCDLILPAIFMVDFGDTSASLA